MIKQNGKSRTIHQIKRQNQKKIRRINSNGNVKQMLVNTPKWRSKKREYRIYSMRWVRANQPAGAIIRFQSIIGQSRKVIDNLIDCNLINKKNLNIFVTNKNSKKAQKSTHTYTDGQLIVEFEYLIFSCFTHLLLCVFCPGSIAK